MSGPGLRRRRVKPITSNGPPDPWERLLRSRLWIPRTEPKRCATSISPSPLTTRKKRNQGRKTPTNRCGSVRLASSFVQTAFPEPRSALSGFGGQRNESPPIARKADRGYHRVMKLRSASVRIVSAKMRVDAAPEGEGECDAPLGRVKTEAEISSW